MQCDVFLIVPRMRMRVEKRKKNKSMRKRKEISDGNEFQLGEDARFSSSGFREKNSKIKFREEVCCAFGSCLVITMWWILIGRPMCHRLTSVITFPPSLPSGSYSSSFVSVSQCFFRGWKEISIFYQHKTGTEREIELRDEEKKAKWTTRRD